MPGHHLTDYLWRTVRALALVSLLPLRGHYMKGMDSILHEYGKLLGEVDAWFGRSLAACPGGINCVSGCAGCCRGLFDITLLDACNLKHGFDRLAPSLQQEVRGRATARLHSLQLVWPDFTEPYILNYRPEDEWPELMPEGDETPCPLLDGTGRCLLYAWRPMTCRLHGLPLIDLSGEVFDEEWCSRNFIDTDPFSLAGLRGEFRRIFAAEQALFREFSSQLFHKELNELDTLILTVLLLDFETFDWAGWLAKTRLVVNPPVE